MQKIIAEREENKMTDRLKNTILCSLLLARKYIITLLVIELLTAAAMYADRERLDFAAMTDILPLLITALSGMSFFERHHAFCTSNAVSRKNRVISAGAVSAVVCLTVAAVSCVACGICTDLWISAAELVRTVSHMRMMSGGNITADIIEMFFFSEALFFFGYFLGGLRCSAGNILTMTLLALFAAVMAGSIFLESFMNFTPAMAVIYIPALMQRSAFTAVLLSIILAAAFFALSIKLSEVTSEKRRGG